MITTEDISKIRQQVVTKQAKQGKVTAESIANIRKQVQQTVPQPIPLSTETPQAEPIPLGQPTQPTYANHGAIAQQGHNNLVQKQATANKTMTNYLQNGGSISTTDYDSLAQLLRENGKSKEEIDYLIGKQKAASTPGMKEQYKVLPGSDTAVKVPNSGYEPTRSYDTAYGKKEGQEAVKNINITNDNQNADVYMNAKADLIEATQNDDARGIAKAQAIIDGYKQKYNQEYTGEEKKADITNLYQKVVGLRQDVEKAIEDYQNAPEENKEQYRKELESATQKFNEKLKMYQEAVAYDEIKNNNMLQDIGESSKLGVLNRVASIENGLYQVGTRAAGLNPDTIDAKGLLEYNSGAKYNPLDTIASVQNLSDPIRLAVYNLTNKSQSATQAYNQLATIAILYPNIKGIQELYKQISEHTYKGTEQDLQDELDRIQKEIYQDFKDRFTQNTQTKNAEQREHNKNAYNQFAVIPNAFNELTSNLTTQALAPIGGEQLALGSMALGAGSEASDQALAEGARYGKAFDYGVLTGATEYATEKMFDSALGRELGIKAAIDPSKAARQLIEDMGIKNTLGKIAIVTAGDTAGEVVEEMTSGAFNPLWKYMTYDKDAFPTDFKTYVKEFIQEGIEAIPSTLLMEATGAGIRVANTNSATRGIIRNIESQANLTQQQKNELIKETKEAAKEVKVGLQEVDEFKQKIDNKVSNKAANGKKYLYDIYNLAETTKKDSYVPTVASDSKEPSYIVGSQEESSYDSSIPQNANYVKPRVGLENIVNSTEEDVKQQPMEYKQRKDKDTTNQRKFFDNAETSPVVAEQTKNNINPTTYERKANLDTLDEVRERLDERGNDMIEEWKTKSKNFTDKDVALGAILIERYQQQGDWKSAARAVEKLADMGTEAGRAVQMYSIFQRLSPETMALYQQKALNKAFEEMKKKKTGKWVEENKEKYKLTAEDTQFIYEQVEKASQAVDEETKQRELSKIENMINQKLPPEDGQAIRALRRIAMLFNPKTQVRNFAGNTIIIPVNDVADVIGTQIDKLVSKKTGIRTTNNPNLITKAKGFKKGIKDAITDYKTGARTTASGSKYEFDIGAKPFNENTNSNVRNAINRKLNGINDLLSAVMSGGDRPFYEAAYKNSLEGQMKANNVTEPTQDMIDIAVNEALQRTWNDDNEYTKTVLGIRRALNKINIKGFGFGDLIIPFAKTPANLTKAMVEYSPAGFLKAAYDFNDMRKAISRGEMTPAQQKKFVSSTSKAIAGTMLYLLAGTLAKSGKITGSADDDKDVKNFEQNVLGIQPYSVRIGDKTYTYSWANPVNAPLAIMADTYKMSKEDANTWDMLTNAFKVAGETLVDNSFLQGIKELFSKDSITEGIVDAVESMPESMLPTFVSQIASLNDTTQRQTFEYQNDFQTIINKIKNKLPGARNTLEPQVNTFGEEIENQNNVFNAFLNPANVKEARITDEQKALYDVYQETKDKTIFPMQAPYYTNTDKGEKMNLTSSDRVKYQKASGQYVNDVYKDLFDNERFNNASNEEKVEILHEVATDGNAKGKEAVGASTTATNTNLFKLNDKIDTLEEFGIPLADYYIAWYAKNHKSQGSTYDAKQKAIRDYTDLTPEQEDVLFGIFNIEHKKGSK